MLPDETVKKLKAIVSELITLKQGLIHRSTTIKSPRISGLEDKYYEVVKLLPREVLLARPSVPTELVLASPDSGYRTDRHFVSAIQHVDNAINIIRSMYSDVPIPVIDELFEGE